MDETILKLRSAISKLSVTVGEATHALRSLNRLLEPLRYVSMDAYALTGYRYGKSIRGFKKWARIRERCR